MINQFRILWVDDEIDLLKPHIMFLTKKDFDVDQASNGIEAIDKIKNEEYDIIFLDENMPGISGLETLAEIKTIKPSLPVVMITKNEAEDIMEEAIGSKISDYLIKPVNPNQILLCLKKNLDHSRLISDKTVSGYRQQFAKISMEIPQTETHEEWVNMYQKLIYWELELENIEDQSMLEVLKNQKNEANAWFFKSVKNSYTDWIKEDSTSPIMSHKLFKKVVFPEITQEQPTIFLLIDNLRYDQWKILDPSISKYYRKSKELSYYSILPTTTQYSRNSIFAGLMPSEIESYYPNLWKNDVDEGGKNLFEKELMEAQLNRHGIKIKSQYHKITNSYNAKKLVDNFDSLKNNDLTAIVFNFVDMLSHAKTEMEVIKELASNDKSYRDLTKTWFNNSFLSEIIQLSRQNNFKLIITTDHGTINTWNPVKVIGDRNTSMNLRYKVGKNLSYKEKDVLSAEKPSDFFLPSINLSSKFIFAKSNDFFAYPNNYNHYVNYYQNTYQHGGVSLEEMIIPCIVLNPR